MTTGSMSACPSSSASIIQFSTSATKKDDIMEGRWRRGVEEEKWDDSREERREGGSVTSGDIIFYLRWQKKWHVFGWISASDRVSV